MVELAYRSVAPQQVRRATAAPAASAPADDSGLIALALGEIMRDGGTQMRAGLKSEAVESYRDGFLAYGGWGEFPAVDVVYDGSNYWVWDGFHRCAGFEAALLKLRPGVRFNADVRARVRPGTQRDAILLAAGANSKNGVHRSHDDKRRAVDFLLNDPEWGSWSNVKIAEACKVSDVFVADRRRLLDQSRAVAQGLGSSAGAGAPAPAPVTYRDRWGNVSQMNVNGQKVAGAARRAAGAVSSSAPASSVPLALMPAGAGGASVVPSSAASSRNVGPALAKCHVCGRPLSDPVHAAAGVGPVCALKRAGLGTGGASDDLDPASAPAAGQALVKAAAVRAITGRLLAVVDDLPAYVALTDDQAGSDGMQKLIMAAVSRLSAAGVS